MARGYRRLSLADEVEIWERLRAGHVAKPTARALGFPTGTVRAHLVRCVRRDPACSSAKVAGTVEFERAGRDLVWSGREPVAAGDRGGPGSGAVDGRSRGRRSWRPGSVPGCPSGPGGVVAGQTSPGVQAGNPSQIACDRGREAPAGAVVTGADRRLVEGHLSRRGGDAGVARDDLPHSVHPVPRCAAQGADGASADRAGDPPSGRHPAPGWPWGPAGNPPYLRTPRRGRRPSGAWALGRRPSLRQTDVPGGHAGGTLDPVRDARGATRRPQGRPGRRSARSEDHHPARGLDQDPDLGPGPRDGRARRFTPETGVEVYFCDPKSPWQRGSNENTNGLLRQYLPRTIDFRTLNQADFDAIADKLNGRPRQTLGFKTPSQVLAQMLR
jgi:transposase, IS30 family